MQLILVLLLMAGQAQAAGLIDANGNLQQPALTVTATAWPSLQSGTTIQYPAGIFPASVQYLTSGSGNYTTPAHARALHIRMIGGGGGGGGASGGPGNGGTGGTTSFNSITAVGGTGGNLADTGAHDGGAGGTGGAGAASLTIAGAAGGSGWDCIPLGVGGSSPFGGAGSVGTCVGGGTAHAATNNSGSGGAGRCDGSNCAAGGGAGEYRELWIFNPPNGQTYAYAVGAAGAGGASSVGWTGGAGGSGLIIVEEFY